MVLLSRCWASICPAPEAGPLSSLHQLSWNSLHGVFTGLLPYWCCGVQNLCKQFLQQVEKINQQFVPWFCSCRPFLRPTIILYSHAVLLESLSWTHDHLSWMAQPFTLKMFWLWSWSWFHTWKWWLGSLLSCLSTARNQHPYKYIKWSFVSCYFLLQLSFASQALQMVVSEKYCCWWKLLPWAHENEAARSRCLSQWWVWLCSPVSALQETPTRIHRNHSGKHFV